MCTHTYSEHKRTGRLSKYLAVSLHYRTKGSSWSERVSERRWRRRLKTILYLGSSAKNQCTPLNPPKILSFSFCPVDLSLLSLATSRRYFRPREYTELRARCKKELEIARFTYQRISILIPWIQFTSWIAQVETIGLITKHWARYRPY